LKSSDVEWAAATVAGVALAEVGMQKLAVRMAPIAVAALIVVAGCGGSSSKKADPTATTVAAGATPGAAAVNATVPLPKPACDFIGRDEIAKALGNPVNDATPAGDTNCTWGTSVDGGTSLDLTVVKAAPGASAEACKDQRNSLSHSAAMENVSGIGDSAVWFVEELTTIRQGHLLACWNNGAVVVLLTGEKDAAALKATATSLAEKVHGNLT